MRLPRILVFALAPVLAGVPLAARPVVVTTNTILADITREVAGDGVEVRCLVAAGTDLHGFEPKAGDVAALATAGLVVVNGAGFEPWLPKLLAGAGFAGTVVEAVRDVPLLERGHDHGHEDHDHHAHDHGGASQDPHAWQDPANGVRYALNIRDALAALDPAGAERYQRRARLYVAQLEALDAWARRIFAALPRADRAIVTSHDALAYFGAAYELEILPVRGLDTRREPDARQIAALVDTLRAGRARALFVESVSNPQTLQRLARDSGVSLGGELHTDSLGAPGTAADSYLGLLRENTLAIAEALERR